MSARPFAVGCVCAVGMAAAAACSRFGASDEPGDGGGVAPDAATVDGAAADAPSDGAISFCAEAGVHDFCEDFDEHTLAGDGFAAAGQRNYETADAGIETTNFVSPPNAFGVELHSRTATVDATYYLRKTFVKATTKRTRVAFDFYVDELDRVGGTTDARICAVGTLDGRYRVLVNIAKALNGALVLNTAEVGDAADGGAYYVGHDFSFANPAPFLTHAWHHLVLTLDYAGKQLALSIDDYPGTTAPMPAFAVPPVNPVGSFLDLGAQTDKLSASVRFYVDDLTVDLDR